MAKTPMNDITFENLIDRIKRESCSNEAKFNLAYYSPGCFSGKQVATLLQCYKTAPEKVALIKSISPRFCRMPCEEAKEILNSVTLTDNDRLFTLDCIKRTLSDHHSTVGLENILQSFEFERDKLNALGILQTISTYVADKLPSGGHQIPGGVGTLYSQSYPMNEHLYGFVEEQWERRPGHGNVAISHMADPMRPPSFYRSMASNACKPNKGYIETRGYPGARGFPEEPMKTAIYPQGGPPLDGYNVQGAMPPSEWHSTRYL